MLALFSAGITINSLGQADIIPGGSVVQKLSSDQFSFVEGPVWYRDSCLLFTDLSSTPASIYRYDPENGLFSIFRDNSEKCNGLTLDRNGLLLGCESARSRIVAMNGDGQVISVLADSFNQLPFNATNDLIADRRGGIYFTDPVFGITPVQDKEAVYYLSPAGELSRIIDHFSKPNGVVLSPDGMTLYVVDTENKYLYSADVDTTNGSISGLKELGVLETSGGTSSGADGMAIDMQGNICIATTKGIQVFSPGGTRLVTIAVPETPTNCDFGGKDLTTLYITARKNLYSIELAYPGYVVWKDYQVQESASEPHLNDLIRLYPNPSSHDLIIEYNGTDEYSLRIFSGDGRLERCLDMRKGEYHCDVSKYPAGIHIVQIASRKLKSAIQCYRVMITR